MPFCSPLDALFNGLIFAKIIFFMFWPNTVGFNVSILYLLLYGLTLAECEPASQDVSHAHTLLGQPAAGEKRGPLILEHIEAQYTCIYVLLNTTETKPHSLTSAMCPKCD